MRELNPIGRDQNQLLLTSDDGERFSVAIDDTFLKTIKENRLPDVSGVELSPREIQDAIRAGATVSELAESSGGSIDLIERFAHPVLEELSHMVELAKSVRVELPADRFNDVEKRPFGEIVEAKLAAGGALNPKWSAKRGENTVWEISVHFEQSGEIAFATWSFDPRRYLLTPETSNAASLSTPGSNLDTPLTPSTRSVPAASETGASVVTADKLEAFRKRREQTEQIAVVVEEELQDSPKDAEPDPIFDEPAIDLGEETQEAVESPPVSEPKKSRPPMPSWDEIVRGTQSDDGEAF